MIVEVPLTNDSFRKAIVDDVDSNILEVKWSGTGAGQQVLGYFNHRTTTLGRMVLERKIGRSLKRGEVTDHVNRNTFDCRRSNVRIATRSEMNQNKRTWDTNKSGYKGVSIHKQTGRWQASITYNYKQKHLGLFDYPEQAYVAYCRAAEKYHGDFARVE